MGIMVYYSEWVLQDLYHQPLDDINPALQNKEYTIIPIA